ncbi:hypothetical protein [Limosilactobacillus reuteri]|uniref:hypothetical protein n=1 Tax=Limosilactobacillus reuteri TaxID=1598 RepID=UPI001C5A7EDF|nr:hypothetical protein [Limosilactobacillus reuteri]MBW3349872.1 hypothetical protein [Limosilactobacillus reuteri]UUW67722.1 hypothetical protein NUJ10_06765 [Limosilactobacillus reuteri]
MSMEVKVLSTSTRTNLEALKHHMKKLGFKYFKESHDWIYFCMNVFGEADEPATFEDCVCISTRFFSFSIQADGLEVAKKAPEISQAILDFYEAEGIKE